MPTPELHLEAAAAPAALDEVHALLVRLWQLHPEIAENLRFGVETAVAEVAANIIQHGGPGVELVLDLTVEGGAVTARFQDSGGPAADPAGRTPEMPDVEAESGRGLALVRALVDEVTYERVAERNTWTLVRRACSRS